MVRQRAFGGTWRYCRPVCHGKIMRWKKVIPENIPKCFFSCMIVSIMCLRYSIISIIYCSMHMDLILITIDPLLCVCVCLFSEGDCIHKTHVKSQLPLNGLRSWGAWVERKGQVSSRVDLAVEKKWMSSRSWRSAFFWSNGWVARSRIGSNT